MEVAPYFDCDRQGLAKAYRAPLPYLRDGLLFYHKQGHYACGHTSLVCLFKDEECTRRFNADSSGDLIAALKVVGTHAATVDGVAFPIVGESLEEPLVEGELARFVVVASNDSCKACARNEGARRKERSPTARPTKIAFFLRRRAGGGLRFNDLWCGRRGRQTRACCLPVTLFTRRLVPPRVQRPEKRALFAPAAARRRTLE